MGAAVDAILGVEEVTAFVPSPELLIPTPAEITVWRLRKKKGMKDHQTAEVLGIARETVNRRFRRASEKIKSIVESCGGECDLLRTLLA